MAVSGRPSEVEIGPSLGGAGERLTLKWSAGVEEVSLVEGVFCILYFVFCVLR